MKLRLSILLLAAAALAAAPASGQTIKSLGYNTTNGNIVAATNVTFTNSVGFATNARATTRTNLGGTTVGNAVFTATNTSAAQVAIFGTNAEINTSGGLVGLTLSTNETKLLNPISFPFLGGATAAATSRTNLGLGGSDSVTFSNLSLSGNGSLAIGGMNLTAITSGIDLAFKRAGSTELELKTNGLILHVGSYAFSGGNTNGASTTRNNLGLGATNEPTFSNIQLGIFGSGSAGGFVGRNSGGLFQLYGTNLTVAQPAFYGYSGFANVAFSPSTARTNLELGATNNVTFSNVTASGTLAVSNTATFSTNVSVAGSLSVGSFTTTTPSTWALDATQTAAATNGVLTLPSNANVIRLTNNNAISSVTNGVLGAFYYLVNQATNAVTISNVGGITIDGAQNLTLSPNESATLVATGPTNVSVAARGDLTDVALGGTANTAPSQTASSGSSLMTRDLSDARYSFSRWYGANEILSGAQVVSANPLISGNAQGHPVSATLVTVSNSNTKFMLPVDYRVSGSVKVVSYWTDRTLTNSGTNGDIAVWTFPFVVEPVSNTQTNGIVSGTQIQSTFTANYGGNPNFRYYVMEQTVNFATVTNISATNPMQLKWVELQRRAGDATDTSSDSIYLSGVHIYVP
jgi:hypothetical protein